MEKIKRPSIAHFLDVSAAEEYSDAVWERLGYNVSSAATEYNPQSETSQDIVSDTASTDLTGYQPTLPVEQQCTKGDPVFEFVNDLRRKRATFGDSYTWLLNVDTWDTVNKSGNAEVQRVSVQIDNYGGDGGAAPTIGYTLNYVGDAIQGTVTITSGEPTFTAGTETTVTV